MPRPREEDYDISIVDEIVGREPAWIIRWGTAVIFLSVMVLIMGTWLIKYPELVQSRITITTEQPPVRVVARSSGKLERLFVESGDRVEEQQPLALLENTAAYEDILWLEEQLSEDFIQVDQTPEDKAWKRVVVLGELQEAYSTFIKAYDEWRTQMVEDYLNTRIEALQERQLNYKRLAQKLTEKAAILREDLQLLEKEVKKQENLYGQGLVSENEVEATRRNLLAKRVEMEETEESAIRNQISAGGLAEELLTLRQDRQERHRLASIEVREAFQGLRAQLDGWRQRYLMTAPASGTVSLFRYWSPNQYVTTGEEVMTILPEETRLLGKIYLSQVGSGKVATGQRVRVSFDGYPATEFGMVQGRITTFAKVAREQVYLLEVELPDGLMTTYGKRLEFKQQMQGNADIITRDMRLIERVFNQFRHLFKNN